MSGTPGRPSYYPYPSMASDTSPPNYYKNSASNVTIGVPGSVSQSTLEAGLVNKPEPSPYLGDAAFGSRMSVKQRKYSHMTVMLVAEVVGILGVVQLKRNHTTQFSVLYGISTVMDIFATGFLLGFGRQIKEMGNKNRGLPAVLFILAVVLVYTSAYVVHHFGFTTVCVIVEHIAYNWYTISLAPAQWAALLRCLGFRK